MKVYRQKVQDEEFFAKFGGVRSFLGVGLTVLQVVSASTASAGLYHFMNLQWQPARIILALLIAALLEFLIRKTGYPTCLWIAEQMSGQRAYYVEAGKIETWLIILASAIFIFSFLTTATFTISGSRSIGQALRDPGPAPDKDSIHQVAALDITAAPKYADDPRRAELADLEQSIPAKQSIISKKDAEAKADWAKRSPTYWPSMAHTWDNLGGRRAQARELDKMKTRRAALADALAGLNADMDREIKELTYERYNAAMGEYRQRVETSEGSGAKGLLIGVVCQFLVIPVYIVIMLLDLGTGQVKRRVPLATDNVNVPAEAWAVFWHRLKLKQMNKIAKRSASPLGVEKIPERIDMDDRFDFMIRYMLGEDLSEPGKITTKDPPPSPPPSPSKPAYAIGTQFSGRQVQEPGNGQETGRVNGEISRNISENKAKNDHKQSAHVNKEEKERDTIVIEEPEKLRNVDHATVTQFSKVKKQDAYDFESAFDALNNRLTGIEKSQNPQPATVTQFFDDEGGGEEFFAYRKSNGEIENYDAARLENYGGSTYYKRALETAAKLLRAQELLHSDDIKERQKADRTTARLTGTLERRVNGSRKVRNCVSFFREAGIETFGIDFLPVWEEKYGGNKAAAKIVRKTLQQ